MKSEIKRAWRKSRAAVATTVTSAVDASVRVVVSAVRDHPFSTMLRESPARTRGDQARDEGRFGEAAESYREHLEQYDRDFPIWVQLGHMLKDSRRPLEADYAYGRALALRPHDVDLLMHYGSLKRSLDKRKDAAALFSRCAEITLSPELIMEMTAPDMDEFLSDEDRRLTAATVSRGLADILSNVTLIGSEGVVALGDRRVRFVGDDPWFNFRLPQGVEIGKLSGLHLIISGEDPFRRPAGSLFLDYGDGFDPNDSIHLTGPDGQERLDIVIPLAAAATLKGIRWDPDDKTNTARIDEVAFLPDLDIEQALAKVRAYYPPEIDLDEDLNRARAILAQTEINARDAAKVTRLLSTSGRADASSYDVWRRRWIEPARADYDRIAELTAAMPRRPTFSFVIPVYDTPIPLLIECLESMLNQTYQDFEICIADDRSPDPKVFETLERYARRDPRIKVVRREHNGHISAASNSALALATGEFVVLLDHDDLIPDYCLFTVAWYINQNPHGQIFFSDEDKITISGERFQPYFKGAFDPYLMFGHNMVSHLGVYRRELLQEIGGFRLGLEGSQDYDLLLRCWEKVGDEAIVHIPHVLYHWRAIPGSTAVSADQKSYAILAAQTAINTHFARTGSALLSVEGFAAGNTGLARSRNLDSRISIIIPTRDGLEDLRACIDSILRVDHRNTEILIVDNGSSEPGALAYLETLARDGIATVIAHPQPFNFSELNNLAATQATGDILCFLNNDTEVVSRDWLDRARVLLADGETAMVGARLLYPDGALQHFGVLVGTAEHRVASHAHHGLPPNAAGYFSKARLTQQFSAVTAACMFLRRDVFDQVGGFDPALRVAYNDVDLCLKVRQAGYRIVADGDIVLVHKESRTRGADTDGEKAARLDSEAALMRSRWGLTLDNDPFYSPNHSLDGQFHFAHPPRAPMPWRIDRDAPQPEPMPEPEPILEPTPELIAEPEPERVPWVARPMPEIAVTERFDDLPAEVSAEVLRRRYPDLAELSDEEALSHYERHGREEGRIAADVAERPAFLKLIDHDARILEIGPYFTPQFVGPNIRYLDVFDADTLRAYATSAGADPAGCPVEIHYTNGLGEAAGEDFDVVYSSHAIEHQPDLVLHLQEVADALKPGGMYWIVCPDKRFCFDHKRPASNIADVLDARGRTRNTRRAVIDQIMLSDHNDPVRHWRGDHDDVTVHEKERLTWALAHLEERGDAYIDVHAWQFTPPTFRKIVTTLIDLQMIPFTRVRVWDTPRNGLEFMAVLGKDD